jgi:hypothetical protein
MVLWLLMYERKSVWLFAATDVVITLVGLVLTDLVYQTNLIDHLMSARRYSVYKAAMLLSKWLTVWLVPLIAIVLCLYHRPHDKYVVFCAIYAAIALVIGVLFTGGAGTGASSLFDVLVALALSTAIALNRWDYLLPPDRRAAFAVICLAPMIGAMMLRDATRAWFSFSHGCRTG